MERIFFCFREYKFLHLKTPCTVNKINVRFLGHIFYYFDLLERKNFVIFVNIYLKEAFTAFLGTRDKYKTLTKRVLLVRVSFLIGWFHFLKDSLYLNIVFIKAEHGSKMF